MLFQTATKLAAPVAFFGYAVFANIALVQADVDGPGLDDFVQGGFTKDVDTLYRANLPHREVAVSWVGAARYVLLNEGRKGVVAGEKGWLFTSEEYRAQDADALGLDTTVDWMVSVQAALAEMGSDLVIVPVPAKLDIDQAYAGDLAQAQAVAETYDRFMTELAAKGVTVVDTRPALVGQSGMFFPTDTHWTSTGAATVAAQVAASGAIDLGTDTFIRTDLERVDFVGDLVSFVTSDDLGQVVGLKSETVTPYRAEIGEQTGQIDLFGNDGPAPLVLVGTSYSANPNWSFVEALKLNLRHDVLNYAEQGQGPVAPMHAYMASLDPVDAPPVVIWEFPVRYLSDPSLLDSLAPHEGDANVY